MGFLKSTVMAGGLLCWLAGSAAADATACPLSYFDFSGYVQGRVTGLLFNRDKISGTLTSLGDRAGGEATTQALIERLEFTLQAYLPWPQWQLVASAGLTGSQSVFKDFYLAYRPDMINTWKAGRFRVPFGLDPQTSSAHLDTVERPLMYGFGNFGWAAPLGMNWVGERDLGVRADWDWPEGFAGFAPFVAGALASGNGLDLAPGLPPQIMLRGGFSNRINLEGLRHEFTLGASWSGGWKRFTQRQEQYLPIGTPGDLETQPAAAIAADDPGASGTVSIFGIDALIRMNDLVLKGEALWHKLGPYTSQGYYVTGIWEHFPAKQLPLDLVLRWEEATAGFADGIHAPGQKYQAATAGLNWHGWEPMRVQINYIALLLNLRQHAFPGSDLLILQVQYDF